MAATMEKLYQEALSLSEDSRLALAERLIESVPINTNYLQAHLEAAERRADELDSGAVQGIAGPEALRIVRESMNRSRS